MSSENNIKTGFQDWCEANDTTEKEMLMLLKAQGDDPWQYLGDAIEKACELPSGREAALRLLLGRGRSGSVDIPVGIVNEYLGTNFTGVPYSSKGLPALIAKYSDTDTDKNAGENATSSEASGIFDHKYDEPDGNNIDVDAAAPADQSAVAITPVAKPAARKKTKYSITKSSFENLGFSSGDIQDMPSGVIRQFLLSVGCKAQDVAVMSDSEAAAAFGNNYALAHFGSGCLVLDKSGLDKLRDLLAAEGYYIPGPDLDHNPESKG